MKFKILIFGLLMTLSCTDKEGQASSSAPASEPYLPEGPLKIAFITDTHYGQSEGVNEDMLKCIEDINSLDSVSFVLVGGDITHFGADAQLHGAKEILDRLRYPYWIVQGNHDSKWSESGCNTYLELFGYEEFEFEAGGYRFIGCSSGPEIRMAPALVPKSSMDWLRSLKPGKPMIFLNHYPLDDGMSNWFDVRKELMRLDCRFAIAGHLHYNESRDCYGLPCLVGTTSQRGDTCPSYNIINIRDGLLTVSERRVYDEGAITTEPWITRHLTPVSDRLVFAEDGLPEEYPYFRYSDNRNYPQVNVRWQKTEDAGIAAGFAVDGDTFWYTTASGKVSAASISDGRTLWIRRFPGKIYSTPVVKDGVLVFGCTDGTIYALSAADGREIWSYPLGKPVIASPAIWKDAVYMGSADGRFRSFNLQDGKLLWWSGDIAGYCDAAPYVDDEQVIFGSWGGQLYSLDPVTGERHWAWKLSDNLLYTPGSCTPLKAGNRIYIAIANKKTYCIDASNGKQLFNMEEGRESLALSKDGDMTTVYIKSINGKLMAFDALFQPSSSPVDLRSEGLWYVTSGLGYDIATSSLAACGDLLLVPSDKGNLHALNASTGAVEWVHKIGMGLVNPVSAWEENGKIQILASSTDGIIEFLEISQ